MSDTTLVIPKSHADLLGDILERMGCLDFRRNENRYAPDFSFTIGDEIYWGYIKGLTVVFSGTEPSTLNIINQQYESILKELRKQETKD